MNPVRTAGALVICLGFPRALHGQSTSFSTDFDGRGTGGSIRIDYSRPSSSRPSSSSESSPGSSDNAKVQQFLYARYEEQRLEVERRANAERLRLEMEKARHLKEMRRVEALLQQIQDLENNEPSAIERQRLTQRVLDLQREFETTRSTYLATLPRYRARLAALLNHINVPPPTHPLHYKRILIWGLMSTPEQAREAAASGIKDPFSGEPFDDVFAFGTAGQRDWIRVGLDHVLGHFSRLSPETRSRLGLLNGAVADEVVCHSNGCRIAQVLIATGMLKVSKLRVLGGDNAAIELDDLKALKDSRGLTELSVYMLRGDKAPLAVAGWRIMEITKKLNQPMQTFQRSFGGNPSYQLLGLTSNPGFSPTADIQVHVLSYPASPNLVDQHLYSNYSRVVTGWRMSKCMEATGAISQRCLIY